MMLRKFLSWNYKNADDRRELNIRNRMMRIHEMDSVLSFVAPTVEFVIEKPTHFSRVETINVRPKPLHF